jgi:hypothetical protein
MNLTTWARRSADSRRGEGCPRLRCTSAPTPAARTRAFSRLNCLTDRCNARAPSTFVIFPVNAALTNPARGTSFLLIVKVSIEGGHFHGTVRG